MNSRNKLLIYGVCGALSLCGTGTAWAQTLDTSPTGDVERSDGAKITQETAPAGETLDVGDERGLHDAFQPEGVEMGSFILFPTFELGERYNSNFFATEGSEEYDAITSISPQFFLRSRLPRHSLDIRGDFEYRVHARHPDDNQFNSTLSADGVYELDRNNDLNATISNTFAHEDRGSPDAVNGETPTPTLTTVLRVGSRHSFGPNTIKPSAQVTRSVFYDVDASTNGTINNDDRDRTEIKGTVNYSREIFPGYAWVVEGSFDRREYDDATDDTGVNRDSIGGEVLTGIGMELSNLVRGDVLVGYMARDYADSSLNDPSGVAVQAAIHWTPTKLTVISPSIRREIAETTQANATALVSTTGSLTVRHELRRDTLLGATGSYSHRTFEGTNRTDDIYRIRGQVTHAFTREVFTRFETEYKLQDSNRNGSSYDQTIVSLTLGLRM